MTRTETTPCPGCGHTETRRTYDIGSGPELSCRLCEWCWGADGQELKPLERPRTTCPKCGMSSSHPMDIVQKYCGNCHEFYANLSAE